MSARSNICSSKKRWLRQTDDAIKTRRLRRGSLTVHVVLTQKQFYNQLNRGIYVRTGCK